ncbi:MAG: HAMP domain-containing protein, partial [Polyangiaceae bacterium]|nr:HAMP domain-containing protein [Polyangiaceae bacterium]
IAASPRGDYKGDIPRMFAAIDKGGAAGERMDAEGNALISRAKENAKARAELTDAQYGRSRSIAVGLTLGVLMLGILATWIISRAIATPLGKAVQVLERVAQGDLTARLTHDARDEVGQLADALDASLSSIAATLLAVQETSQEVSAAAAQLSASAEHISSGAQEQAASLEETAASLEEISSTVKQNTDSAQHAAQLASGARDTAERGGQVVESAVAAMTEITKSSRKIAEIITTIDEIAFQTNLLALNAAVEAARAGDQGRGFGVVAAEVRTLAQRTGSAAKDIRVLIADSTSRVEVGTAQVNQSGQTLDEIVKGVKRVTDMVAEIAAASREQSTGVEQVNTAVTQVDQVTQLNAAQTEELSATANGLSDKAVELQERVARFHLGGTPTKARPAAPVRSVAKATKPMTRAATKPAARVSQPPQLKVVNGGYEEF